MTYNDINLYLQIEGCYNVKFGEIAEQYNMPAPGAHSYYRRQEVLAICSQIRHILQRSGVNDVCHSESVVVPMSNYSVLY